MSFEIKYSVREKTHAIATWRNILLIESRLEVPVSATGVLRTLGDSMRRDHPEGFGYLTIVEPSCKSPSSEARAGATQFIDEFSAVIRGSATVFLGDGLRGAFVRAVVASMMALSRSNGVPHEICASVDEGSRWLAGRMPGLDARALSGVANQVREATAPTTTAATK